jgi:ubiquinone/menaquinone biosynthesis C-methylase UbiE
LQLNYLKLNTEALHVRAEDPLVEARHAATVAAFVSITRTPAAAAMSRQATVSHPLCARLYVKQAEAAEPKGLADQRRRMLAGLAGHVVEIGAGNGLNFGHYPSTVAMVHAFEPEPYLRALAEQAAENAAVAISVGEAVAEDLPLGDASVDAAVASLVLCSVKDLAGAIAEIHRVVQPGGELRFNEHVASQHSLRRAVQRAADATVWPTISGGCHLGRETEAALEDGGFRIERVERFEFSVSALDPTKTHILGTARRV